MSECRLGGHGEDGLLRRFRRDPGIPVSGKERFWSETQREMEGVGLRVVRPGGVRSEGMWKGSFRKGKPL